MNKQTLPPLSAFNGPSVEHVTVWTTPLRSAVLEILPHHKQAIYFGDLQIDEASWDEILEHTT